MELNSNELSKVSGGRKIKWDAKCFIGTGSAMAAGIAAGWVTGGLSLAAAEGVGFSTFCY